ncbi:hypothetical protein EI545_12135 [Tabrizicola piscis]|uniref:Uncharacterized protein n=1 Tax=Tabrizicola piscis TaxID=2494374 RepID=A0A3S8U785_9RHOB|nr:hypothetical protein [Tabrizicola piscis]AZL59516.1 hypothetical protein EI545_12135 [Tabrizicola piscis]
MFRSLEDGCHILLVAADPVESFGNDDVERSVAGGLHQSHHAGPRAQVAGAERVVAEHLDNLVAGLKGALLANTHLVIDGGTQLSGSGGEKRSTTE